MGLAPFIESWKLVYLFRSTTIVVMWAVNGENGIHGVESEEFPPHFRINASWSDYVEPLDNFL